METINLAEKYNQEILISMQVLNNIYVCLIDFGLVFHAPVRIICSLRLLYTSLQSFTSKDNTIRLFSTENMMMLNKLNDIPSI